MVWVVLREHRRAVGTRRHRSPRSRRRRLIPGSRSVTWDWFDNSKPGESRRPPKRGLTDGVFLTDEERVQFDELARSVLEPDVKVTERPTVDGAAGAASGWTRGPWWRRLWCRVRSPFTA